MKVIYRQVRNLWTTERLHSQIKAQYKKSFKKKITTPEINKIWSSYIEEEIINNLALGQVVNIDKCNRVWVKATKTIDNKRAMALLEKGLMFNGKRVVEANMNLSTSEYIYDIVFESTKLKSKEHLYFEPHANLSKAVRQGILKGKLITRTHVG